MIKRILVALDPDNDTPAAIEYARYMGHLNKSQVTGLAIVDTGSIHASSKGGGIGSTYLASKVETRLMAEARDVARQLTGKFQNILHTAHSSGRFKGEFRICIEEGIPVQQLAEAMNYQDLLVIGKDPHFFYSHPEERSLSLESVIRKVVSPVLIVPGSAQEILHVSRILIAYDGSPESTRAMRTFMYLSPFGTSCRLNLVHVRDSENPERSKLLLQEARSYCELYDFKPDTYSLYGIDPATEILNAAARLESEMVVVGAHFVTPLSKLLFGSTTSSLVDNLEIPMWVQS